MGKFISPLEQMPRKFFEMVALSRDPWQGAVLAFEL
jgi:hypothetical protein